MSETQDPIYLNLNELHRNIEAPILDLDEDTGMTGYLDFITEEMMTSSVMKGVDAAGRPFIALKTDVLIGGAHPDVAVLCLFLRYEPATEGYNPWVEAGAIGYPVMCHDAPKEAMSRLEKLLRGEVVSDGDDLTYQLVG